MARQRSRPQVPENLKALVADVGGPVSSADVDTYGKIREIHDRSHQIRTIVSAWKEQQKQDRELRARYARWLMGAMAVQASLINVIFVLMGCGLLSFESWTARTFIVSVFGEIAALVLMVVKYLFTPSSASILQFLESRGVKKSVKTTKGKETKGGKH